MLSNPCYTSKRITFYFNISIAVRGVNAVESGRMRLRACHCFAFLPHRDSVFYIKRELNTVFTK